MTEILQNRYCLAVRHDLATTVFFMRATRDEEALSEARRIVECFTDGADVPVELRRAEDPTEWRSASAFRSHLRKAPERTGAVIPISNRMA